MTFREVNVRLTTVTSLVHEKICLMSSRDSAATQPRSVGWVINMSAAITRISCIWRRLTVAEGEVCFFIVSKAMALVSRNLG